MRYSHYLNTMLNVPNVLIMDPKDPHEPLVISRAVYRMLFDVMLVAAGADVAVPGVLENNFAVIREIVRRYPTIYYQAQLRVHLFATRHSSVATDPIRIKYFAQIVQGFANTSGLIIAQHFYKLYPDLIMPGDFVTIAAKYIKQNKITANLMYVVSHDRQLLFGKIDKAVFAFLARRGLIAVGKVCFDHGKLVAWNEVVSRYKPNSGPLKRLVERIFVQNGFVAAKDKFNTNAISTQAMVSMLMDVADSLQYFPSLVAPVKLALVEQNDCLLRTSGTKPKVKSEIIVMGHRPMATTPKSGAISNPIRDLTNRSLVPTQDISKFKLSLLPATIVRAPLLFTRKATVLPLHLPGAKDHSSKCASMEHQANLGVSKTLII